MGYSLASLPLILYVGPRTARKTVLAVSDSFTARSAPQSSANTIAGQEAAFPNAAEASNSQSFAALPNSRGLRPTGASNAVSTDDFASLGETAPIDAMKKAGPTRGTRCISLGRLTR